MAPKWIGEAHVTAAARKLRRAERGKRLCRRAARRLDEAGALAHATELQLRSDRYDTVAYFGGETAPLSSRVHARCWVGKKP